MPAAPSAAGDETLNQSVHAEAEQDWPAADVSMATPLVNLNMSAVSAHTPAPPTTAAQPGAASGQRGTSPLRRGHARLGASGFTVPSSVAGSAAGADGVDESFAIQRLPASSPRGSTVPRCEPTPLPLSAAPARQLNRPAASSRAALPGSGRSVTQAKDESFGVTPSNAVSKNLFSQRTASGLATSSGFATHRETAGKVRFDLNTPSVAAEDEGECVEELQQEVEAMAARCELLSQQLHDERATNAGISAQLRHVRPSAGPQTMPCLVRMTVGKDRRCAVLSSQALIEGKMRRQQSITSEPNAAQREAEREKLAAYMSRRLKL